MKKAEALKLFDNNVTAMARAVGVSRYTIHRWDDELTKAQINMVTGARHILNMEKRNELDSLIYRGNDD